jgi:hypothetical protein
MAIMATILVLAIAGLVVGLVVSRHSGSISTTTSSIGTTTTTDLVIPTYNSKYNARQDVTTESCSAVGGAWTSTGKIVNEASAPKRIEIVIDFVDASTAGVVNTKLVKVARLAAHATTTWSVTGAAGDQGLNCAIRWAQAWPVK